MSTEIAEMFGNLKLRYAKEAYRSLDGDVNLMSSITVDDAFTSVLTAEIDGRAAARRKMLMNMAKIPFPSELRDVQYDDNRGQEFVKVMSRVRTMSFIETGSNVCILGSSGSGKSFVASALAREAVAKGYSTYYTNTADEASLLAEKRHQGASVYQKARSKLARTRLLILDDFCLNKPSDDEIQSLFDIMNDRSGRNSTMVISQKDQNRWLEELGITAIGEAVVERIRASSITVMMGPGSRRRTLDESAASA